VTSPAGQVERSWYVGADGRVTGPYPQQDLRDLVIQGTLPIDTPVSCGGEWVTAREFLGGYGMIAENGEPVVEGTPPPPPPPPRRAAPTNPKPAAREPVETIATADEYAPPEGPVERDRIVVLGRRQSGKTIYLATVYARLWRAMKGTTAKALSGEVHKQLMGVHQMLREGQWPPSTLGTSQIDLELEHHGRKRLLVALDFAGELFGKAFLDEQSDWPGVKELVSHIDRAAAVILLVDPAVVAGMDRRAAMEDDFGLVQAVQRIRNWPGGDTVPIVLVLTKMDQHQHLLDRHGGGPEFIRKHFPALVRLLKQIPIMQVSAVQVETGPDGHPRPRPDSTTINIDGPLQYCLREITAAEQELEARQAEDRQRMMRTRALRDEQERRSQVERRVVRSLVSITAIGAAAIGLILYFQV
jgi:hypothetical protein